jgi:atlastin
MGGEQMSQGYQQELENEISELYCKKKTSEFFEKISNKIFLIFLANYKKHNDSKNVFAFSRTPTTFISTMIICYLIAGILDTFWLGGVNFIFMFGFWVCFGLLTVWLYTKYSGEYAEIGEYIDHFADIIWNNVS